MNVPRDLENTDLSESVGLSHARLQPPPNAAAPRLPLLADSPLDMDADPTPTKPLKFFMYEPEFHTDGMKFVCLYVCLSMACFFR